MSRFLSRHPLGFLTEGWGGVEDRVSVIPGVTSGVFNILFSNSRLLCVVSDGTGIVLHNELRKVCGYCQNRGYVYGR